LIDSAEKSADLDPRVLDAYIHQCTAEAQEGTNWLFVLVHVFYGQGKSGKNQRSGKVRGFYIPK